jgi:hypothetical protein
MCIRDRFPTDGAVAKALAKTQPSVLYDCEEGEEDFGFGLMDE